MPEFGPHCLLPATRASTGSWRATPGGRTRRDMLLGTRPWPNTAQPNLVSMITCLRERGMQVGIDGDGVGRIHMDGLPHGDDLLDLRLAQWRIAIPRVTVLSLNSLSRRGRQRARMSGHGVRTARRRSDGVRRDGLHDGAWIVGRQDVLTTYPQGRLRRTVVGPRGPRRDREHGRPGHPEARAQHRGHGGGAHRGLGRLIGVASRRGRRGCAAGGLGLGARRRGPARRHSVSVDQGRTHLHDATMRILAVSDIHNNVRVVRRLRAQEQNAFDLIVAAGDIGGDRTGEVLGILATFCCPVLYVLGNHDGQVAYDHDFGPTCHHLHHRVFEHEGVAIVG